MFYLNLKQTTRLNFKQLFIRALEDYYRGRFVGDRPQGQWLA